MHKNTFFRSYGFAISFAIGALLSMSDIQSSWGQTIVAHRGSSAHSPENTLAAFRLAWEHQADAIEGDFHMTSDGEIVCCHDRTTEKRADRNLVIADSTLAELQQLDVGSWKGTRWSDQRMPTLEQVFEVVPDNKRILVEVKCGPEIVETLMEEIAASDLDPEQITIIAFDADVIEACKENRPDLQAFWLTSFKQNEETREWSPSSSEIIETLERCHADGLDCNANTSVLTSQFVDDIRERGYELHVWTVNDEQTAKQMQELGVDSITTDVPGQMREFLR